MNELTAIAMAMILLPIFGFVAYGLAIAIHGHYKLRGLKNTVIIAAMVAWFLIAFTMLVAGEKP